MQYLQCPKCGMKYHPKAGVCPKCKITPEQHLKQVEEKTTHTTTPKKTAAPKKKNLRPCKDCGEPVSKSATACPKCGAQLPKEVGAGCGTLIFIMLGIFIFTVTTNSNKPKPPQIPVVAKSESAVENNRYDGGVYQAEAWLKQNLKDPDSLQVITWGKVMDIGADLEAETGHRYATWCRYRAKNSFGGYSIATTWFYLDKQGRVVKTRESQ